MKSQGAYPPGPMQIPLTHDVDADFRFMAASDLTTELVNPSNPSPLDDSISYKIVDAILNALQDQNGEVQNMSVKWYPSVGG